VGDVAGRRTKIDSIAGSARREQTSKLTTATSDRKRADDSDYL
jgi:hypothetical protein